jgi:hypothetical protein
MIWAWGACEAPPQASMKPQVQCQCPSDTMSELSMHGIALESVYGRTHCNIAVNTQRVEQAAEMCSLCSMDVLAVIHSDAGLLQRAVGQCRPVLNLHRGVLPIGARPPCCTW